MNSSGGALTLEQEPFMIYRPDGKKFILVTLILVVILLVLIMIYYIYNIEHYCKAEKLHS